jgi:hypothetical protein
VREERVTVEKEPVIYEEVGIGWDEAAPRFRQQWQTRFGTTGGRWEDYEAGYRYGYEMAADPRYHARAWTEVEPELRSGWTAWGQRHGYAYCE